MRIQILALSVVFVSLGMLLSGMQTITGYYADPSGYGFYHIQGGYFALSLGVTMLGGMLMMFFLKRARRFI